MEQAKDWLFDKLKNNLDELMKLYRQLLEVLRAEKDVLVSGDIEKITESNKQKEMILLKLRSLDGLRQKYAVELAREVGADTQQPRLLDLANRLTGGKAQELRNIHAALEILVKRAADFNRDNSQFVESALSSLNGAVKNIQESLSGQKTYKRQGVYDKSSDAAGHLVSREA